MKDKGFTLIELVISMVLLFIILTPAYALLKSGLNSWVHGTEHIDVVQNMRVVMDRMTSEIRQGVKEPEPVITASKIEFYVPKINNGGDFSGIEKITYQYDAADKEVERKEGTAVFQPVSSKIKSLTFTYNEPQLEITLVGVRKDGYEITMTSQIILRSISR